MRFSELEPRRVAVWGAGRETRALARRLHRPPLALISEDGAGDPSGVITPERVLTPAAALGALEAGDVVVRSPGVSIHRPELVALRARGVHVGTATGLWLAEHGPAGVIGVTGTKGKSTTATLLAALLRATGASVALAGNIGAPALDLLDGPATDWTVLELSSYQIADLTAGPRTALFTNLADEHVDWHGSLTRYRAEKLRLLALPELARAVLPADAPEIAAAVRAGVHLHPFGATRGWHVAGGAVRRGEAIVVEVDALPLRGEHNAINLCAALTALQALGVPAPDLPGALREVTPLPHRLQTVRERDGVEWIDDSISTTPGSAIAALRAVDGRPTVLIAGGQDREQHHAELAAELARRDAAVIGLPDTGARLVADARAAGLPPERAWLAADLPAAVAGARELVVRGGVVLLSPAAPSYHAYENFERRGEHFAALAAGRA